MMDQLLASSKPEDAETMCMMLLMCGTAGRGDDCRERRICELVPPMLRKSIGRHSVCLLVVVYWLGR
jgi:hypothetical protein